MNAYEIVEQHNKEIDDFIKVKLSSTLKANDGFIRPEQWFKAQMLIREQGFYEKGKVIMTLLRGYGYDVKMNMQSHKLSIHE